MPVALQTRPATRCDDLFSADLPQGLHYPANLIDAFPRADERGIKRVYDHDVLDAECG